MSENTEAVETTKQQTLQNDAQLDDSGYDPDLDTPIDEILLEREQKERQPEKPAKEPPKRKHSVGLVKRAKAAGFSDEELDEFTSSELIEILFRGQPSQPRLENSSQPKEQQREPEQQKQAKQAESDEPEIDLGDLEKDLGEDLSKVLKEAVKRTAKHYVEQQMKPIREREEQDKRQKEFTRIDQAFNSLGEEWAEVFGKGAVDKVSAEEVSARVAVLNRAAQLAGKGDMLSKLADAAREMYGRFVKKADKKSPPQTQKQSKAQKIREIDLDRDDTPDEDGDSEPGHNSWYGGGLHRPTSRAAAEEPKGETRAARAVARQLRGEGRGREEDGLPD